MKLGEIKELPTIYSNVHESIYKSYHTLQLVKELLNRGDSNATIKEIIKLIEE